MNLTHRRNILILLSLFAGIGASLALPVLVSAQNTLFNGPISLNHITGHFDPDVVNKSCPPFPMTVSNPDEIVTAINCFNALVDPGTYSITLSKNINLFSSPPDINNPKSGIALHLDGAQYSVNAQNIGSLRPLKILSGTHVTISDITIRGGDTRYLADDRGGGIWNTGYLTLTGSTVSYNYAQGNGGGIFNGEFGVISIENSKIIRNFSRDTGGGIRNSSEGIIMIADSEINWNSSVIDGGGISVGAGTEIYIYNSHINYNTCFSEGEDGGGGFHGGASSKATIHNSTISWNSSPGLGGGFDIGAGHDLTLTNSTVSGNVAGDGGGGIFADAGGYIRMTNATISANRALTDTLSYRAGGGAIALVGGADMDIQYSTIVSNTTPSLEVRNGIYITDSAALTMSNSIVANHIDDCQNFNTFTDAGYNLVEDGSCITETTSLSGDPLLGTLQDNGGDTETHALQVGSNALDHIPIGVNGCGTDVREDQRGYLRPGFLGCDIGSYERTFVKAIYQPIVFKE